jgi:16S rRNA (cytosine967-C5)-methyltransferase
MKSELRARYAAIGCIQAVIHKQRPFEEALTQLHAESLQPRDRAFAQTLVMQVLRRGGEIDAILAQFMQKPLDLKLDAVRQALRLGVVQLLWLDTPPHAAIATTVDLVKALKQLKLAGLTNAVLRRVAEQKESLKAEANGRLNTPEWLWNSWVDTYGIDTAKSIAQAHTQEPPLDLTVRDHPQEWAERLQGECVGPQSVRRETGDVMSVPGYDEGAWWVQDVAATLPALLFGDVRDKRVYDLCAAPGGKTAQLASAGAQVLAVDRSAKRLVRLKENMQRLGLQVDVQSGDLLRWQPESQADAILLDVPCSATGTIRRHPDILYHRTPEDVAKTTELQREMLDRAAQWLKPAGQLVYCVCSLQPEEGEAQITAFLARNPQWQLKPVDAAALSIPAQWVREGVLRTLPHYLPQGMDGFFAACLVKLA